MAWDFHHLDTQEGQHPFQKLQLLHSKVTIKFVKQFLIQFAFLILIFCSLFIPYIQSFFKVIFILRPLFIINRHYRNYCYISNMRPMINLQDQFQSQSGSSMSLPEHNIKKRTYRDIYPLEQKLKTKTEKKQGDVNVVINIEQEQVPHNELNLEEDIDEEELQQISIEEYKKKTEKHNNSKLKALFNKSINIQDVFEKLDNIEDKISPNKEQPGKQPQFPFEINQKQNLERRDQQQKVQASEIVNLKPSLLQSKNPTQIRDEIEIGTPKFQHSIQEEVPLFINVNQLQFLTEQQIEKIQILAKNKCKIFNNNFLSINSVFIFYLIQYLINLDKQKQSQNLTPEYTEDQGYYFYRRIASAKKEPSYKDWHLLVARENMVKFAFTFVSPQTPKDYQILKSAILSCSIKQIQDIYQTIIQEIKNQIRIFLNNLKLEEKFQGLLTRVLAIPLFQNPTIDKQKIDYIKKLNLFSYKPNDKNKKKQQSQKNTQKLSKRMMPYQKNLIQIKYHSEQQPNFIESQQQGEKKKKKVKIIDKLFPKMRVTKSISHNKKEKKSKNKSKSKNKDQKKINIVEEVSDNDSQEKKAKKIQIYKQKLREHRENESVMIQKQIFYKKLERQICEKALGNQQKQIENFIDQYQFEQELQDVNRSLDRNNNKKQKQSPKRNRPNLQDLEQGEIIQLSQPTKKIHMDKKDS